MSDEVFVIGVGITKFGEHWNKQPRDLFAEAALEAVKEAGIELREIEALFVGSMSPGQWIEQENLAPLLASHLGLQGIPAIRVEGGDASSALAFYEAYTAIKAGEYDLVLAAGVEKTTDASPEESVHHTSSSLDREFEAFMGNTLAGAYAMMARAHMMKYGTTREQLALVAVKNHEHAMNNPKAQFRRKISVESVIKSPIVAEPLRMLDGAPLSDGSAVAILASRRVAKEMKRDLIRVLGVGIATDQMALHDRVDISFLSSTKRASSIAYRKAGVSPKEVNVAELHLSLIHI